MRHLKHILEHFDTIYAASEVEICLFLNNMKCSVVSLFLIYSSAELPVRNTLTKLE